MNRSRAINPGRSRWRWWQVWLLACLPLAGACLALNAVQRHVAKVCQERVDLDNLLSHALWMTRQDVEELLVPDAKLPREQNRSRFRSIYDLRGSDIDPKYHAYRVILTFRSAQDDRFIDERLEATRVVTTPGFVLPTNPSAPWVAMEYLRETVVVLSPVLWLMLATLVALVKGMRRPLAGPCVAIGLTCMLFAALAMEFTFSQWRIAQMSGFNAGAAMAFAGAILWWIPTRRPSATACASCGYDLHGNVSGICPECGTPTPAGIRERGREEIQAVAARLDHAVEPNEPQVDSGGSFGVASDEPAICEDEFRRT